jgi:hypothetical protein
MENWQKVVAWYDRQSALEAAQRPGRDWRRSLGLAAATALALALSAAILLSGRYQIAADQRTGSILRLDRITGAVRMCLPAKSSPLDLDCSGSLNDWVDVPTK